MYSLRIPAISKYKVKVSPSATKADFDKQLPPSVRWPADNYNHLLGKAQLFFLVPKLQIRANRNTQNKSVFPMDSASCCLRQSKASAKVQRIADRACSPPSSTSLRSLLPSSVQMMTLQLPSHGLTLACASHTVWCSPSRTPSWLGSAFLYSPQPYCSDSPRGLRATSSELKAVYWTLGCKDCCLFPWGTGLFERREPVSDGIHSTPLQHLLIWFDISFDCVYPGIICLD